MVQKVSIKRPGQSYFRAATANFWALLNDLVRIFVKTLLNDQHYLLCRHFHPVNRKIRKFHLKKFKKSFTKLQIIQSTEVLDVGTIFLISRFFLILRVHCISKNCKKSNILHECSFVP